MLASRGLGGGFLVGDVVVGGGGDVMAVGGGALIGVVCFWIWKRLG